MKNAIFRVLIIASLQLLACERDPAPEKSLVDKINSLGMALADLGYTNCRHITGFEKYDPAISPVSLDKRVSGGDTIYRAFAGYEKIAITADTAGKKDTVPCLRLFVEYDSVVSKPMKDFDVFHRERDFEEEAKKKFYRDDYRYWPKTVRPKIKWVALVYPEKCINVTFHAYPSCDIQEEHMDKINSTLIAYFLDKDGMGDSVDSICKMLDKATGNIQ